MLISAWILVISNSYYAGLVSYSPPLESLQECQRLSKETSPELIKGYYTKSSCIQVKMYIGVQK